jgi:tetratricopeptide (TPR) repeat protein
VIRLRRRLILTAGLLAVAGGPTSAATPDAATPATPAASAPASSSSAPSGSVLKTSEEGQSAERSFDEWRFAEGRAKLAEIRAKKPDVAEVSYLEGYARFLEGDYAGAVAELEKAAAEAPADPNTKELVALAAAARDAVKDHKEVRSRHFVVRYPVEDAVLVPYALEALEAAHAALVADLGFAEEIPVRVEFYRSPTDLAAVSSLSAMEVARTGTIALCKWARLMVTTPRALSFGYPWLDSINHELVHYAVSTLTRDKAPVWLQEGIAKFLERRWREPAGGRLVPTMEHLLAKALRGGKLIGFDAMHPSMAKLPSAEDATVAFAEVATAIGYLHARGGMAALRTAIAAVAEGTDARKAVAAAAGGSWAEFERGWKGHMASLKLRTYPGFDIPTTHIRKPAAIASRRKPTEDEALAWLKASTPLRYLRLGNMMLKRNRPRAAVVEYEKGAEAVAAGRTPAGPDGAAAQWLFPVKLGRTYLALGDPDRALKALAAVQATYPELPWPNLIAGQALLAKNDAPGAVAALRASLATNPFDPAVHCALASAYARLSGESRPSAEQIAREQQFCKELAE